MQAGTRSQLQLAAVCSKQATAVCSKQAATVCSKQAATKSEKSNLHTKNAQAARLQQTMSRNVAATKSCKVAATKSRKVAATKSSKTNLHTINSQGATMPQLAAAAKPHACCLFAAIHCEKHFISLRVIFDKFYIGIVKRHFFVCKFATELQLGLGENTGTPVYRGISLVWYVPRHTCPYRGILVFLFIVTENLKSPKY